MALIKCPKCAGVVSTKASACPHCGAMPSDKERLEKLADELGSMSAAIAFDEEIKPVDASKGLPEASVPRERTPEEINQLIVKVLCGIFAVALVGGKIYKYARVIKAKPSFENSGSSMSVDPANFR